MKSKIKKPEIKVSKDSEGNFIIERIAHGNSQKVFISNKENDFIDEIVKLAEKYRLSEKTKKKLHKETLRVITKS